MRDTHHRRDFFWFAIDGLLAKDDSGWMFWFKTPLFGFMLEKNWIQMQYTDERRASKIWFGLIARWPCGDGGIMYRWHWEHYFERKNPITGKRSEGFPSYHR